MKKLNKTIIIWGVIIISVVVLGFQVALYFQEETIPVLKEDLAPGKQITIDMIEEITVNPNSSFLDNSYTNINDLFRDGDPNGNNGKYAVSPLFKGQPIDRRALVDSLTDTNFGIGAKLEDANHVAISVLLPIQNAVGVNFQAGQLVNLTYALGSAQTELGQSANVDPDTLVELKNIQVLDIRNVSGLKVAPGSTPTGKEIMLILSIPSEYAPNVSLAAAGQGIIYISLPSVGAVGSAPVNPGEVIVPEETTP